jgi:tetratricopeptide (TPR) repeat protein
MRKILILTAILSSFVTKSQNTNSKQIDREISKSVAFLKTDHTQAYTYSKKALDYSKSGTTDDKIKSISNFINILIEKGEFPAAHQYLEVLKYLAEENNSDSALFEYYLHTSSVLIQQGFHKDAEKAVDTSFFIARKHNLKDTGILIYNLALIDIETLKAKPAIVKLEKAYDSSPDNIRLMRLCKICLLPYTGMKSKLIAAVSDMDTVIANLKKENDLFMLGQLYNMLGNAYLLNFNFYHFKS